MADHVSVHILYNDVEELNQLRFLHDGLIPVNEIDQVHPAVLETSASLPVPHRNQRAPKGQHGEDRLPMSLHSIHRVYDLCTTTTDSALATLPNLWHSYPFKGRYGSS